MSRKTLKKFLSTVLPIMEIGPRSNPFLKKDEYKDVYYADIRNVDGINDFYKKVFVKEELIPFVKEELVPIDYVIKGTYLETVGEKRFSAVFSSHVIEHTADIIRHLEEVSQILEQDGHYVICIPDKRYTFDYFRDITPFRDAYDVYINGNNALKRLTFDHSLMADKNLSDLRQYLIHSVSFREIAIDETVINKAFEEVKIMNDNIGRAHYWVFTFPSFLALLRDCLRLNILPYTLEYAEGTTLMSNEFYIVLKKDIDILKDIKRRQAEITKINAMIESPKGIIDLMEFVNKYEKIYIYGSPQAAKFLIDKVSSESCSKIVGLVISDGFQKEDSEFSTYFLSEIVLASDVGIILAMREWSRNLVHNNLQKMGFTNILNGVLVD